MAQTPGPRSPGRAGAADPALAPRATFSQVFAVREFRVLWASQALSVAGDRLALVALTLVVYDRTRSPLLAAAAYAAGYVPYFLGSLFLSGLADRLPRRDVMIACDLSRCALVTAMLLPHVPVAVMIALLYGVTAAQPAFDAARAAALPDMVPQNLYALAIGTMQTTFKVANVAGAAASGILVALSGPRLALAADAATFAASAAFIRLGIRASGAAARRDGQRTLARLSSGVKLVFTDPGLRTLLMFGWLGALYVVPAGIAGPYAASLGKGTAAAGLVVASTQVGGVLAAPLFTRVTTPAARLRWMGPMAVCACMVLVTFALRPGLVASMAVLAVSGVFAVYQIAANAAFVARLPNEQRAQAFGVAAAGLFVGQGVSFMIAGALCQVVAPSTVIAASGGLGALLACALAIRGDRVPGAADR